MKPRFSKSSRHTGHIQNIRKQKEKFPTQLEKVINDSDILLEILDARFINETHNLEIEEEIKKQDKKIIHVLNKADLVGKFSKQELTKIIPYAIVSCRDRKGIKLLRNKIKFLAKRIQKLKLTNQIFLLDSPGVIPKKEYSTSEIEKISRQVRINARSYNQVRDPEMVVAILMQESPEILENYYEIKSENNSEKLLEELGNKKHFFKKGGEVDFDKTARFVLKEWQQGKIRV